MKKMLFVLGFIFLFTISVFAGGRGFLYIIDSGQTSGSTDIDTCYNYAENTIRPALDHWLDYYTDYDIDTNSVIGSYLSLDSLSKYDGIIISPFIVSLINSNWQDTIAAAVNDSGVGLFNCDPQGYSKFSDDLFDILPIYCTQNTAGFDSLFTQDFNNVQFLRESRDSLKAPEHFINQLGYINERFSLYEIDSSKFTRFTLIDSVGSTIYGRYNIDKDTTKHWPALTPIIVRNSAPYPSPVVMAGYSPSGKAHTWTLTDAPDWWSSPLNSSANGWGRHGTMSDVFWLGLAYVAKGGLVLKVPDRSIVFIWDKEPPMRMSSFEFLKYNMVGTLLSRNIPICFRLYSHPGWTPYSETEFEYWRSLQDKGCDFMLNMFNNNVDGVYWVDRYHADSCSTHTIETFRPVWDSINAFITRSKLEFNGVIGGSSTWDLGDSANGYPVYTALKQNNWNRTVRTGGNPLYFFGSGMSISDHRNSAKANWYPLPFGNREFFQDNLNHIHDDMFCFKAHRPNEDDLYYDWQYSNLPDTLRLDSAFVRFKASIAGALEGGIIAGTPLYRQNCFALCNPQEDNAKPPGYSASDSVYWASVRWDSLFQLCVDYVESKDMKWVPTSWAMEAVHNLNLFEVTDYRRDENVFYVTLTGSTYAETEFTVYYGEGGHKERISIEVPVFSGSLNMNIRIVRDGFKGYCAEIY